MWKAVAIDRKTYRVSLCGRRSLSADEAYFPQDPFSSHDEDSSEGWNPDLAPRGPFQQATSLGAPGWSREFQEAGMFSSPAHTLISEEVLGALPEGSAGRDVLVPLRSSDSCGRPGTTHDAAFPPTHCCGWLSG
uniref:Uncharacterized protein n=1 Tax=Oncorhynchus mykiss TaxID=8022 RepID=A0A8C7LSS7_ONCMY